MKSMRVWGMLSVLVMCASIAIAQDPVDMEFTGVGNWTDPNLWDVGSVPGAVQPANYVNIMGPNTVCTVNTDAGDYAGGSKRMQIDNGATLVLEDGGVLASGTWSRIGVSDVGTLIQTGGRFEVQGDKLGIGDKDSGQGYYVMSGGTLTFAGDRGDLGVGSRTGTGTFTVIGTAPVIQMEELIVCERDNANGTVEFVLDAGGVSPIVLTNTATIDTKGDTTNAALVVRATAAPPMADILLVDITSENAVNGVFDTVNGEPAAEGTAVILSNAGVEYSYHLTYVGGTGNDIVLVYESSATVAVPFSLQAVGDIELGNDNQVGPDSASNGSGLGARDISVRRRVFLLSYDISSLKDRGPVSNVSFSHFSHDQHGEVNVYGVIEDLDLLDVESLTWNTAPGVQNEPTPDLEAPVALDPADLTEVLLTFGGPGETGVRFSTDTSAALADFINSDTDGILTFLVAPAAEGNQLIVRARTHSAGGSFLEGLAAPIANIIWVSDNAKYDFDADQPADAGFVDLLRRQGYIVDYKGEAWPYDPNNDNITLNPDRFYWQSLDPNKIDELNAADLVIISRIANSGAYDDKPDTVGGIDECIGWNSVTTPMISMSAHLARSGYGKWGWLNCSGHPYTTDNVHNILDSDHAIFAGIEVDANNQADLLTDEYTVNGSDAADSGNGMTLATRVSDNAIMIATWDAGIEYFDGSGYFAGGPRMFFAAGSGNGSPRDGIYNLTADGETVFLNAVTYMLPAESAGSVNPGTESLMVSYSLDNNAADGSGNGHDGTVFGDPAYVEGVIGMAMEFDGEDYVDTGYTEDLASWTISAWIKSPTAPAAGSSCGPVHRESNYQINWVHWTASWRGSAGVNVGGQWYSASFGPLEADTWYHLTGTYDGENLKAYKDGILITDNDSPSGAPSSESNSLKLARHAASDRFFNGTIDEVRIFNRALSDQEILYLAGL